MIDKIARALYDVWVEAKQDTEDNWNDVTFDDLPEKHKVEYYKTAKALLPQVNEEGLLTDKEIMKAHEGEKCRDCGRSIAKAQKLLCDIKNKEVLDLVVTERDALYKIVEQHQKEIERVKEGYQKTIEGIVDKYPIVDI